MPIMLQRFLLLWLTLLSLAAFYWPEVWSHVAPLLGGVADRLGSGFDPFIDTHRYGLLKPLFIVTMFAIGCALPRDEIRQVVARWPTVLGGTAIQYTAMPLLAWGAAHAFRLEHEAMTGVIIVGCVPGAMASNVLTLAARGNVSYSVSLTTSATLLSPLVVPAALMLTLGASKGLDPVQVFLDLLMLVVGPVVAGHVLCWSFASLARVLAAWGPVAANGTILWIIATVVGLNRDRLGSTTAGVLAALLAVNLLGYAAGYAGGGLMRLPGPMRRALTLEVGMQNAGLGTVLVLDLFPESPAAAIPTAAYTFGCMLTGTVLAQVWAVRGRGSRVEARQAW